MTDDARMSDLRDLLSYTTARVADYRVRVAEQPVFPSDVDLDAIRKTLGSLPDGPQSAAAVVEELVDLVEPALVATTGPRYFGFVTGGALDVAIAADVLAAGWDQNAFNAVTSPGAALVEDMVGTWLKDLLGLPTEASFGLVTGGQGANTVCLAAARHRVLAQAGWNIERQGLQGGPPVRVVANAERHATIDRALRLLGLGTDSIEPVATDANAAIDVEDLARVLAHRPQAGPTIVCLQAGNVNTGACDDLTAATAVAHEHGAWVHVDGAFGLWAAASPTTRHLVAGIDGADSWATDGHKWLNVPYDCGYAFCARSEDHAAAVSYTASYLTGQGQGGLRAPGDYVLEASRRARGFATWAALRQLGRAGIADLVHRCCGLAQRFANQLASADGATVCNDVVLNQVLVRFGNSDDETSRVIDAVQRSGECWMGGTTWRGMRLMRISVSNWLTTEADVDRSVTAILAAHSTRVAR